MFVRKLRQLLGKYSHYLFKVHMWGLLCLPQNFLFAQCILFKSISQFPNDLFLFITSKKATQFTICIYLQDDWHNEQIIQRQEDTKCKIIKSDSCQRRHIRLYFGLPWITLEQDVMQFLEMSNCTLANIRPVYHIYIHNHQSNLLGGPHKLRLKISKSLYSTVTFAVSVFCYVRQQNNQAESWTTKQTSW